MNLNGVDSSWVRKFTKECNEMRKLFRKGVNKTKNKERKYGSLQR